SLCAAKLRRPSHRGQRGRFHVPNAAPQRCPPSDRMPWASSDFGYGCVIDAGSSGTRIYLYRWPKYNGDGGRASIKVERRALFSDERNSGIAEDNGTDLLDELLSSAQAALPPSVDLGEVPIFLGATAGMRLLDAASQAKVMGRIRSLLHGSGFLFNDNWARMISGEEEGVYGWLVANYLKSNGNFPEESATYGALDLGGGSTQISLVSTYSADHFPLHIGDLNYPIFTHSFLQCGADQARMRHDKDVVLPAKVSPCYPTGYTDPVTDISGSSNWKECFENVAKLFDGNSNLRGGKKNPFDAVTPPIGDGQKFIAMSVFVFTWDFLGLKIGADTGDLDALKQRAGRICNLSHAEQTQNYDENMISRPPFERKTNKPHAQCFNAAYSYHMLSNGYGLPVSQTPIEIYYEFDGARVQWPLGLMLVEANKLHSLENEGEREIGVEKIWVLFGVFILFGYYFCFPRRRKRLVISEFRK
ncbi:hypothetical protein ACHAWF_010350, partial [Thalassiosira exigua]